MEFTAVINHRLSHFHNLHQNISVFWSTYPIQDGARYTHIHDARYTHIHTYIHMHTYYIHTRARVQNLHSALSIYLHEIYRKLAYRYVGTHFPWTSGRL